MKSSNGPNASPAVDLAATSADDDDVESEIEETDIRILSFYGDGEDNGQTLVGLGPPSSRSPVALPAAQDGRGLPRSEPPGPWGSDEERLLPGSIPLRTVGLWGAAVPLLLVAAAVVVFALRSLAPTKSRAAAATLANTELAASEGTGLFVRLTNPEATVTLDGVDQGPPPALLMDLTPGSHVVSVSGPGYSRYEQTVTLIAGHVSTLEPVMDSVTSSGERSAAETPPADPATSGSERPHALGATPAWLRSGPGAVKPVPVELEETPENPYLPASLGVLAASSSPPASVVVDGRPVGKSPRVIDLTPGTHTVAFVHPTRGRKTMTVKIAPGDTTNVAVDF
jgi:hypothetical protein